MIDRTATAAFIAYVPEGADRAATFFEMPVVGSTAFSVLHIDLLQDGNIRLNDRDIVGSYRARYLGRLPGERRLGGVSADREHSGAGGGEDATTTVPLEPAIARFGLGRIPTSRAFARVNAPSGRFLLDEVALSGTGSRSRREGRAASAARGLLGRLSSGGAERHESSSRPKEFWTMA